MLLFHCCVKTFSYVNVYRMLFFFTNLVFPQFILQLFDAGFGPGFHLQELGL